VFGIKPELLNWQKKFRVWVFRLYPPAVTAKVLNEAGIKVVPIQEITGNPESFDGRMKTISYQVEGGILFDRTNPSHVKTSQRIKRQAN